MIEDALNSNETLWINLLTLCELVLVLERTYKLNKPEVVFIVQMLTETKNCKIENEGIVLKGLQDYIVSKQVGFSDCLIGRVNEFLECQVTYTFDKKLQNRYPHLIYFSWNFKESFNFLV